MAARTPGRAELDVTAAVDPRGALTPHLKRLDVAKMLAEAPPPLPWVVEPIACRKEVTLLFGREGRGKSMLAQMLAMAVADPGSIALPQGLTATPGRVLIIDAENGESLIHRRLHQAGLTDPSRYVVMEADGLDLRDEGHKRELLSAIRRESPDLIVLDGLASLAPGIRENDSEAMGPWMMFVQRIARQLNAAVVLLHHATKTDGGTNYRGSGAIGAVPTLDLALIAHDGDPDPSRRELRWGKVRIAARPDPAWVRITSNDGALRIEEADPFTGEGLALPTAKAVLANQMVAVAAERGALQWGALAAEVGRGPDDGAVKRARAFAIETGRLIKTAHGTYGPPSAHPATPSQTEDAGAPSNRPADRNRRRTDRPDGPELTGRSVWPEGRTDAPNSLFGPAALSAGYPDPDDDGEDWA